MANTNYYYDFHYSLPLVQMLLKLLGKSSDPGQESSAADIGREWFSQPRPGTSPDTECITVAFRLPLSVSEISVDILRMPCLVEIWYQDRSNNWRPVLDGQRAPLKVRIDRSDTKSWFKWVMRCYPIVAKRVQFRLTRYNDGTLSDIPYPVGMRNALLRRNVYDRSQGGSFEDELDSLGNTVSRYVKDWDASAAADDNYTTFWRSAPQPDPAAVVSLYLDVRSPTGAPQVIDRVYLDPVYYAHLNLYYSNDDTVATRRLSQITLPATEAVNTNWRYDRGLIDTGSGTDESYYRWPLSLGPLTGQDCWIGVDWRPGFASASDPELAHNPILFAAGDPDGPAAKPVLHYDPENRVFVLQFFSLVGTARTAASGAYSSTAISEEWSAGDSIKIVAGWRYGPDEDRVWIAVVDARGRTIASLDESVDDLPDLIGLNGTASVSNFRGALANLVVKLESPTLSEPFLASPTYYCDPDPVIPDSAGRTPSTSLDNALYAAPFLSREHGSGGSDQSHFADKTWVPIWRDYTATKGMLHLPQPIAMQYLKLEFTNLSEQPYPIYESGIDVTYKVFPVSVTQSSSLGPRLYTGQGGFLGLGTFISANGVRSVNWLDPNSVMQAIGSVITPQTPPVIINTGSPYLASTLPNQGATRVEESRQVEAASSYVYSRDSLQPYILAQDQYTTLIGAEGLASIQPYVDVPWAEIEAANPGAVTKVKSTGTVPIRGSDWWIYPGQQLKIPASVMTKLTETQTVTERKLTLETRTRFTTTSVHRYEERTIRRDAAIAYFAGVREVQPYTSTYIVGEDTAVYRFPAYTPDHWVFDNIRQTVDGPVTADQDAIYGILTSQELTSKSDFVKVKLDFQDSGATRSNPMWVDITASTDSINDTRLSPYFGIIPTTIPRGSWSDPLASWSDSDTVWGSSYGLVTVNVDPDRRYQGRRVVHFTRAGEMQGRAGISLAQWTNFVPGAQFRVGAIFYRPKVTTNTLILRLTRSDGTLILEEPLGVAPGGRWFEATTAFTEIPETLSNASFDNNLIGWIPAGGAWTAAANKGRTGTKSARLATNGTRSTLTSERMECMLDSTVSASGWVTWTGITPGSPIRIKALFYNSANTLVTSVALDNPVTPSSASTSDWHPVSGATTVPTEQGITQVAFQVEIPAAAGSGGSVWVDDFSTDVPGAPRQQFTAELTVEGDEEEELYVSDLYTETTPIRYFVRLGPPGTEPIEVTDLRYTKSEAIVTATTPVNQMQVQAVITTPRAYAFGCTITPMYLR